MINVSFNTYAGHEVDFVAKIIWSRNYVPNLSRHEVILHFSLVLRLARKFINFLKQIALTQKLLI